MRTLFASFADAGLAEKAAGALLDHGARPEDISIVHSESYQSTGVAVGSTYGVEDYRGSSTNPDDDNDVVDAGDSVISQAKSIGNRAAEYGDRAAGAVADAVGAEGAAANYRAAADERDRIADQHQDRTNAELRDAADVPGPNTLGDQTTGTSMSGNYGTEGYTAGSATSGTEQIDRVEVRDVDDDAEDTENAAKHGISTTTAADAGSGAVKGAAIGLGVGALAAIASLLIPGVGIVVGGGALAIALGGAAAATGAGAVAGGVTGYLKDQGMDNTIATEYSDRLEAGGAILSVNTPSGDCDEHRAHELLTKYGANHVHTGTGVTTSQSYMA